MGYAFTFETGTGPTTTFAMNTSEMSMMRELMREVGAVSDPTTKRAMSGPPPGPTSAAFAKFTSSSGQLVTPDECRAIADRLRGHMGVVLEVASFFDDAPSTPQLKAWVLAWADYNERAASAGGYSVR